MRYSESHGTAHVNGVDLFYVKAGQGKPVLLVHGNGESHALFSVQIRQLAAAGYQVWAMDSRGQGANAPLPEYHYAQMAEDVYRFIGEMGLQKPAYYGHSDGGIIGLMTEIAHPGTLGLLAASGANLSPRGLAPGFLARAAEENERCPEPLVTLMLTEPDITEEELKTIAAPVLVTAGSRDLILPEETRRIAAALPRGELVILEGEDHGSYISGSEKMGRLLLDFLKRHGY